MHLTAIVDHQRLQSRRQDGEQYQKERLPQAGSGRGSAKARQA